MDGLRKLFALKELLKGIVVLFFFYLIGIVMLFSEAPWYFGIGLLTIAVIGTYVLIVRYKRSSQTIRTGQNNTFSSTDWNNPVAEKLQAPAFVHTDAFLDSEELKGMVTPIYRNAASMSDLQSGSTEIVGERAVHDAENSLLLTDKRLIWLMLGPQEVAQYADNSIVTQALEWIPADATGKRALQKMVGGKELHQALTGFVSTQQWKEKLPSMFHFWLRLDEITKVSKNDMLHLVTIETAGGSLRYTVQDNGGWQELQNVFRKAGLQ